MMMMTKLSKSTVSLVVLALAAGTALHFHSGFLQEADKESSSSPELAQQQQRELAHGETIQHPARGELYHRVYRALGKVEGLKPESPKFNQLLHDEVERRKGLHRENGRRDKVNQRNRKVTEERRNMEDTLRDSDEIWLRGDYLLSSGSWRANTWDRGQEVKAAAEAAGEFKDLMHEAQLAEDYEPLRVCNRPAEVGSTEDLTRLQKYGQCPDITADKPILLLEGTQAHGRTGNNLIEFLHAIQMARDQDYQLGVMAYSWATEKLMKYWFEIQPETEAEWTSEFERAFCVKMFYTPAALEGWDIVHQDTKELFYYRSETSLAEYIDSQNYSIRTLFRNYNTGVGRDRRGYSVQDMCSGINAMFGEDRQSAIYSVIHSRTLEGEPGFRLLAKVARKAGCDKVAALEMRPDYIKSILEPLGMMNYPIVFISDGQNPEVLERLMADPEIGPLIHPVPNEACWIGGDLTLAVMSNVFIGNPASSFTGFIAKARLAFGFGHNYLFRAKDENDEWRTVCGDHCIYDKTIMEVMS